MNTDNLNLGPRPDEQASTPQQFVKAVGAVILCVIIFFIIILAIAAGL